MSGDRWQEVKELFLSAAELEPGDRSHFLDRSCGPDGPLRREVESLLAADRGEVAVLAKPLGERMASALRAEAEGELAGTTLGPYRVIRELGRGGSSTVYLAARDDEQYRQRVAVKVIGERQATPEVHRRFRRERQILASLDHPNIARLLDAGATDDGWCYFVMELVQGQRIDRYCDANRLSVGQRLELFRTVCEAVHHAHQNLVVHRDLKPSNVLVVEGGQPKLLDFGIAKLLNPELSNLALEATLPRLTPMTPLYASPEQVRGEPITTASDVYSLGVMLFELLTGRSPYRLSSRRPQELERAICERDPERPSQAVARPDGERPAERVCRERGESSEGLPRRLRGDLDAIVLKALRKEPTQRYSSVEQLSGDLGRHLEHLPVLARRGTAAYRAGKFVRRHKLGAFLILLLVTFGTVTAAQSARLARALDQFRQERRKSDEVAAMMVRLFQLADPSEAQGRVVTARSILDRGTEQVRAELADQPEVQASLLETIGVAYRDLGLLDSAGKVLESALEIRQRHHGGELHPQVVESLQRVAEQRFAREDYEAAERFAERALASQLEIFGREHAAVADSLHFLGETHHLRGGYDEAEKLYRQALEIRQRLFGEEHGQVADSWLELSMVAKDRGELAAAEPTLRKAVAMARRLHGEEHPTVASMLIDLGRLLWRKGELREAETHLRGALATRTRISGPEHHRSAKYRLILARLLADRGELEEAEALIRRALETYHEVWPEGHPRIGDALRDLGELMLRRGEPERAEPLLRQGALVMAETLPIGHWRVADMRASLGRVLFHLGRLEEAEPLLFEAQARLAELEGPQSWRRKRLRGWLAELDEGRERPDVAARHGRLGLTEKPMR